VGSDLLRFRAELERAFENRLRDEVECTKTRFPFETVSVLDEMIRASSGPSLSTYLLESGTLNQFRELCIHRSAYQLRKPIPIRLEYPD